jgi:hypothetical protein
MALLYDRIDSNRIEFTALGNCYLPARVYGHLVSNINLSKVQVSLPFRVW